MAASCLTAIPREPTWKELLGRRSGEVCILTQAGKTALCIELLCKSFWRGGHKKALRVRKGRYRVLGLFGSKETLAEV